ncbi:glycosyltransferase [Kaistella anthropi]|nr:glycosyltransferase [Kaistella anthropi]
MLTVVIPYFKISYFEETLKSLANQTDQRFKVFIGDDASPECPAELLRKYQGAFSFSYRRYSENLGGKNLTKQWERCLENVQSEWFMILGDDDYLSENAVEEFYKNIQESNSQVPRVLRFHRHVLGGKKSRIASLINSRIF